jgi:hypothetical protein
MNLTTPPPVEDLDRADEMRSDLVRRARESQRRRPTWVPVLAAACGIAVITTGVVVLSQTGDDVPPLATTPTSTGTPPDVVPKPSTNAKKVPADQSPRQSLDLGPASNADAVAAARTCLADKTPNDGDPIPLTAAEADTATSRQARWIKIMPGVFAPGDPSRLIAQTFTTAKGDWIQCLGGQLMRSYPRGWGGLTRDAALSVDQVRPVNGQWTFSNLITPGGPILAVKYSFVTTPNIARLELRIRYPSGAGRWYGVPVLDGAGYISISQGGVFEDDDREVDYRAFDASGKQVSADIEYG